MQVEGGLEHAAEDLALAGIQATAATTATSSPVGMARIVQGVKAQNRTPHKVAATVVQSRPGGGDLVLGRRGQHQP